MSLKSDATARLSLGARAGYPRPTTRLPSERTLRKWVLDTDDYDGSVKATDGCKVEPDGRCIHNHVSWLVYLGWI